MVHAFSYLMYIITRYLISVEQRFHAWLQDAESGNSSISFLEVINESSSTLLILTPSDWYFSKHRVVRVDTSYIHLKLLNLTIVFLSTMFPQGRSFLFIAERFWVFFPSGIHAPWCFSHVDAATFGTFNLICHTLSIARSFPLCPSHWPILCPTYSADPRVQTIQNSEK